MRGIRLDRDKDWRINRAKQVIGDPRCDYMLNDHNGGFNPTMEHPWSTWYETDRFGITHIRYTCDCVGFVVWCLGIDRCQPATLFPHLVDEHRFVYFQPPLGSLDQSVRDNPAWVNCDSMIDDADHAMTLFMDATECPGGPKAGDLIVVPSRRVLGFRRHGHVGLLMGDNRVAHCSPRNERRHGRAIYETEGDEWSSIWNPKRARWLRYVGQPNRREP